MTSTRVMATSPCANCPFKDGDWLREDRRKEIADSLKNDQAFFCHSTVDYESDEDGVDGEVTSDSRECVGAHVLSVRSGFASQYHRNLERFGIMPDDEDFKDGSIPWKDLDDWVLQGGEREYVETCSVVNPGCEAPAGFMTSNGGISYGEDAAEFECEACGEPVCGSCMNDADLCAYCAEYEDE